MIDISTMLAIHRQATEALLDFRVAEGIRGLEVLMQECQDQQLARELEAASLDYGRMLDFLSQGGQDEEHSSIQDNLVRHLLRTLDATARQIRLQKCDDLYSKAYEKLLNAYGEEPASELRMKWNEQQGMTERYETEDLLFDLLWTTPRWDSRQTAEWFEFLSRLDAFTQQHLLGGIILSLWEYFDTEKLTLLRLFAEAEQDDIRWQAITAYALLTLKYQKRLVLYPTLQIDGKRREVSDTLHVLQRELILMKESPRVNKAINQELSRFSLQQVQPEKFHQELEKILGRYGKLLALGIDLDLNKVSLLHSSRFLRSISHWWAPFDESRPMVQEVFIRKDGELAEGLRHMFSRSAECSVSRYAVCEAMLQHIDLTSLDQQILQFMQQKREAEEEEADEEGTAAEAQEQASRAEKKLRHRITVRGFVQNLYRFLHHSPLAGQVGNIFEESILLPDCPLLRPYFPPSQKLLAARLLLQLKQNADSLRLLREVADEQGSSAELLRLMGQCKQNEGALAEAAQFYLQADLLEEDDLWTLCQLEICYVNLHRYDRLWDVLQRLERLKPGDASLTRRMAACLILQDKHAEALNYLYKLELDGSDDPTTLTQIAFSSAHIGRFDTAEKYMRKRLERDVPLNKEERLMAGAIAFVQNQWHDALSYFQQCDLNAFDMFRPRLFKLGITPHDVQLMHDMIERSR